MTLEGISERRSETSAQADIVVASVRSRDSFPERFRAWLVTLAAGARQHRLWVLVAAIAAELAFLVPMGLSPASRHVLGMPGSLLALTVVVTAVAAGWRAGLAAALAGGVIFWGTVADFGARSTPLTTLISTAIWASAALIAGILADALRDQMRRSNSAAVALARAEALREREAERAAREERARIARDLHDSVTQCLFAATLRAEALTIAAGDQAPALTTAAEDVRRLDRGALAQMRLLLLELRAEPLEELPLEQLLTQLVEATRGQVSTDVRLEVHGAAHLPGAVHEALFRITQAALNNVAQHAKASTAWVVLEPADSEVRLEVGDDGVGFDLAAARPAGLGLRSMRERAEEAGADLRLASEEGHGTRVRVTWRAGV